MPKKLTGADFIKALTESNLLHREIEKIEYDYTLDKGAVIVIEDSSEYIGNDEMRFDDLHLIVKPDGIWKLEHNIWVG